MVTKKRKEAQPAQPKLTITQTLRCEVTHPVDMAWQDFNRIFRAVARPLHRVMNNTITALELAVRGGAEAHPRTLAYRLTGESLASEREEAAERVARKKPYNGDDILIEAALGSSVQLGIAGEVYARWAKWDKERWRGTMTLPTFKAGVPAYIAGAGIDLEDKVLTVALLAGRSSHKFKLAIKPSGDYGYPVLNKLKSGEAKLGDLKLVERNDRQGKPQLFAMISYTMQAAGPAEGTRVMAIRRGMHNFLTVAVAGNDSKAQTAVLETGDDVLAHKRGYFARRRQLGRQGRQLGLGAHGHGEARRLERITKLRDAESRYVDSKCREAAAHACKFALARGVKTLLLEDWSGLPSTNIYILDWPYAQLRSAIEWAAKKRGLEVQLVSSVNNVLDCPNCGHHHEEQPLCNDANGRATYWQCENLLCCLKRPKDEIAAWNMLRKQGHEVPLAANLAARRKGRKTFQSSTKTVDAGASAGPEREGSGDAKSPGTTREGAGRRKNRRSPAELSPAGNSAIDKESTSEFDTGRQKPDRSQTRRQLTEIVGGLE